MNHWPRFDAAFFVGRLRFDWNYENRVFAVGAKITSNDPSFFATPTGIAVISAGASFLAGLLGAGISAWTARRLHSSRLTADENLAKRKFEFDISISERKFLLDARSADRKRKQDLAETVLAGFIKLKQY